MSDEPQESADQDQRVNQIIAAFLEAERTGQVPDRADLLRRHPDLATELQSFFADKDRFHKMTEPIVPVKREAQSAERGEAGALRSALRAPRSEVPTLPPSSRAGNVADLETAPPHTAAMDAPGEG